MNTLFAVAVLFCAAAAVLHLASIAVAMVRCRPLRVSRSRAGVPPVTIVRPVCGIENFGVETLGSTFRLDHPDYEVLFCVASPRDPVVPLVERLIAENPGRARLLIGDDRISQNPKLNNMV